MKNSLSFLFFFFFSSTFLIFSQESHENIFNNYYNEENIKEIDEECLPDEKTEVDEDELHQNVTNEDNKNESANQEELNEKDAVEFIIEKKIDDATLKTIQTIEEKAITNIPHKKLDNEIFLFMMGYGEAKLVWTLGFELFKGGTLTQVQSPIFTQENNLSLLFLMRRKWYFGINYKDKALDSSIYMGYIDEDASIKKHIRLGNKGINFPSIYPFLQGGKTAHLSPGVSATVEGKTWRFDSAIRYDSSQKHHRIFYGKTERIEQKTSIFSWQRSQYFYIPHSSLFGKPPRVYVKDTERGQWRQLEKNAFYLASRESILVLNKSYPYGVAIDIFENALVQDSIKDAKMYFAGSPIAKEIEDSPYIDIEGSIFLNLKKHQKFSIFEIASIYYLENLDERSEAYVIEKNKDTLSVDFFIKFDYIEHPFLILDLHPSNTKIAHIAYIAKTINYANIAHRYPFASKNDHIYMTVGKIKEENATVELLSYFYSPVSEYVLPKNANGDDIEVYKNGLPIVDFTFDSSTRILHLHVEVFPSDKIEIRWSESKQYSKTGKVKIATGVQYKPLEWLTLFLANSDRISVSRTNLEVQDEYIVSTGADMKVKGLEAGAHFAMQALTNRKDKQKFISKNHFYTKYEDDASYSIFSHPKIAIDFDANKGDNTTLHSNIFSSINVWKIGLNARLSMQSKTLGKNVIESAGHAITVPLWFFSMKESFFINNNIGFLSRFNSIKWKKFLNIEHDTYVIYERAHTQSGITSIVEPIIPHSKYGNFFLQLKLILNQKYKHHRSHTFDDQSENYWQYWKQSLSDTYSAGNYDALNRNENISFIFNWLRPIEMNEKSGFNVEGVNFETRLKADNASLSSKKDAIFVQLYLPLTFNEVFITPSWKRSCEKHFKKKLSTSYKSDFESMFSSLKDEYWFFSVPIFYDLFDTTLKKKLQTNDKNIIYSFSNTYGLDVSRILSHTKKDLYTPIETSILFTRMVKTQHFNANADQYYRFTFSIKYKSEGVFIKDKILEHTEVVKLFEEKKITSIFTEDEIIRHYEASFLFAPNESYSSKNLFFNFSLNTLHCLMFYDVHDNKTGFENKLMVEIEAFESLLITKAWKEEVSFIYSYQGKKSLISMLFASFSNFELFDIREEKLSLALFQEVYARQIGYKLTFSHTQKTKIGNNGEMKLFVNTSLYSTNRPSVKLEFTFGLAGKVEY